MVDLKGFIPNIIAIESLESLRNQIVYTNRNNYVVDPDQTPFSYPYGANGYFFNPAAKASFRCNYGNLTARERRAFVHSHDVNYPDTYLVTGNYFSPVSYCDIDFGEAMFRDARHYFQKVSRTVEAFKEIAALTGDNVFYTDDELFAVASAICKKKYDGIRPTLLPLEQKIELARKLRYDYNAGNKQLSRLTKIPETTLNSMFPKG